MPAKKSKPSKPRLTTVAMGDYMNGKFSNYTGDYALDRVEVVEGEDVSLVLHKKKDGDGKLGHHVHVNIPAQAILCIAKALKVYPEWPSERTPITVAGLTTTLNYPNEPRKEEK